MRTEKKEKRQEYGMSNFTAIWKHSDIISYFFWGGEEFNKNGKLQGILSHDPIC